MKDRIGEVAGKVYDYLEANGGSSVSSIARSVDASQTKIYMAIGWLAKEDNLAFEERKRGRAVHLK